MEKVKLVDTLIEKTERRYEEYLSPLQNLDKGTFAKPQNKDLVASLIYSALASDKHSFRYKLNMLNTQLQELHGLLRRGSDGGEVSIRVAWGFGKPKELSEYRADYYLPDFADFSTLIVLKITQKRIERIFTDYGVESRPTWIFTISPNTYLFSNYYGIGKEPDKDMENGIHVYEREMKKLTKEIVGVEAADKVDLIRAHGVNLEEELRKEYVSEELKKMDLSDYNSILTHVKKHSQNPTQSFKLYEAIQIIAHKHKVGIGDITIAFTPDTSRSLQYITVPNKRSHDTMPPWMSLGGLTTLPDGIESSEVMLTQQRLNTYYKPFSWELRNIRIGNHRPEVFVHVADR